MYFTLYTNLHGKERQPETCAGGAWSFSPLGEWCSMALPCVRPLLAHHGEGISESQLIDHTTTKLVHPALPFIFQADGGKEYLKHLWRCCTRLICTTPGSLVQTPTLRKDVLIDCIQHNFEYEMHYRLIYCNIQADRG